MSESNWNTTDRIFFGIVYGTMAAGMAIWGIAQLIEACRTRPKIQMMVLGVKGPFVKQPVAQPGPDESPEVPSAVE